MLEVEYKAHVKDIKKILNYLINLGYKKTDIDFEDIYFSHPCRDFRDRDEEIRLRIDHANLNVFYLTYKGPSMDKNRSARVELEIEFNDLEKFKTFKEILRGLGFKTSYWKRKKGWLLSKDNMEITLVTVRGGVGDKEVILGDFVEVEMKVINTNAQDSNLLNVKKTLHDFIKNLPGCGDIEYKYYTELISEKLNILNK